MLAMGAKRLVRGPGAAKRRKMTDQVVAASNRSGSTGGFDLKQAADTAREYMQVQSAARPGTADLNKAKQLPANATTAAQTAPVRVTAKPVASEAMSEQKATSDADAELTARAERLRVEKLWRAEQKRVAHQKALEDKMNQIEAEAARKAEQELLAQEEQAAHQAAAKKAKKDRRKAKKQQQQEEELLQRQQQQQEEELLQHQQQQQQREERQRVQQEMRHQQQLQEEQKLQQQKQAKQQAQKLQQQKLQEEAQTLQGQEQQQKLQQKVQELHEDQTQQEWQEQQRQWKKKQQQQQKQQRSVEQPSFQMHTQQAGHAAGSSSTSTAANTVSASKSGAAEQTEPLLSPEPMHVKQSDNLRSGHRQTAYTVRLDHAEPGQCVIGQHEGGVPTVDRLPATGQQKRFAAPHHLLCCPITQVCYFLLCNVLSTIACRHLAKVSRFICKLCACRVCFWMGCA